MNKKGLNIILTVLLVLIWGSVGYKYFAKSKIKENEQPKITYNGSYSYKEVKDTFNLELNNRDPFKASTFKRTSINSKKKITVKKEKNAKTEVWPKIEYFGFVKGEKNNTKLAIIKVNNKLFRKREKEKIDDVFILKAYSDSLIIRFHNLQKTIIK